MGWEYICVCVCSCVYTFVCDLVPKGVCGGGRGGVLTVNKICFKHFVLLLLCVCIHNWSVSQWEQYELQIWSSWRKKKLKVKSAMELDP